MSFKSPVAHFTHSSFPLHIYTLHRTIVKRETLVSYFQVRASVVVNLMTFSRRCDVYFRFGLQHTQINFFLLYGLIKSRMTRKFGTHIKESLSYHLFPGKGRSSADVFSAMAWLLSQERWQSDGMLSRDVARQVHYDHSTTARLDCRFPATGTTNDCPARPGQPSVTTRAQDHQTLLVHLHNHFEPVTLAVLLCYERYSAFHVVFFFQTYVTHHGL